MNFKKTAQNPLDYNTDPRSVAIGDFNNDSWLDFVVTNRVVNNISVFLGSTNGTFSRPTTYSTGSYSLPDKITVADLNNDQRLDIVVAYFGINSVGIFLGIGDGTFVNYTTVSTNSARPIWIHIAHLDNDTFLDLVTADYGTDSITVYSGDGTGNFSYRMRYPTGYDSSPVSVTSGDLDNDNYLDLAVANSGTNNVGIFFGNGNGTFSDQQVFPTGIRSHPKSIAVGSLNSDELLDIVVANYGTNNVGVFQNLGNGTFAEQKIYIMDNASPYFVETADVNKDQQSDLIVISRGTNNIGILLGHRNDNFSRPIMFITGSRSSISAAIGDLNRDGLPDIIAINNDTNSITISIGKNEGFQSETRCSLDAPITNNTAELDRVDSGSNDENKVRVRRQYGHETCSEPPIYGAELRQLPMLAGDVNNDGHLDIIANNVQSGQLFLLLGHGNGSFSQKTIPQMNEGTFMSPQVSDFNNDTYLDIVVVYQYQGTIDARSIPRTSRRGGSRYDEKHFLQPQKFDSPYPPPGNFYPKEEEGWDPLEPPPPPVVISTYVDILLGHGNGSFTKHVTYRTNCGLDAVIVTADFNKDDLSDIVVADSCGIISVFLAIGDGFFANPMIYSVSDPIDSIAVSNFNNDTVLDIIVASYPSAKIHVLLGFGNGSFANQTIQSAATRPQSITIGDFNSDNISDVVVTTDSFGENVNILLGFGNGSFQNQTTFSSSTKPKYAAIGDFNQDDRLDIVVVDNSDNNMQIFLGNGNGSFTNYRNCSTGQYPVFAVVADFNEDGRLDIVVGNAGDFDISVFIFALIDFTSHDISSGSYDASRLQYIATNDFNNDSILDMLVVNDGTKNIALLLGHGDGSFKQRTIVQLEWNSNVQSIAIGDFNKDNHLDLAMVNAATQNIDMLLGDGRGALIHQDNDGYSLDHPPKLIATDDFNHDGYFEVVVAYNTSDHVDILSLYDPGNFTEQITHSIGFESTSMTIGDFNHDKILDMAVVTSSDNNMQVLLGHGNGSFIHQNTYRTGRYPSLVAVGYFNNDSHLDIVVSNYYDKNVGVLFGYGNGSFTKQKTYSTGGQPTAIVVNDINNDNFSDIVVLVQDPNSVRILLSYGNGSFAKPRSLSVHSGLMSVAVGDVNNDMFMDIIVSDNYYEINVFLGYGNGSFRAPIRISVRFSSAFTTVVDFNNDSRLDIVLVNTNEGIGILLGLGNGSFVEHRNYSVGCSPIFAAVVDLNNDTHLDIVTVNLMSSNITFLLGDGTGSFTTLAKYRTMRFPKYAVIGDFNNDARMDIIVSHSNSDTLSLLLGKLNHVFRRQTTLRTGHDSPPQALATGDFNNDTHSDILFLNSHTNSLGVFLGHTNGSFSAPIPSPTDSSPSLIAVGHLDNDVHLDVVVLYSNHSTIGIHLGNGNGSFVNHTTYSIGDHSQPKSVSVADFDNDGISDIIIVDYDVSNVLVFIGYGNGSFTVAKRIKIGYGTHPFLLAVGDYNNDRKLDFAVGNYDTDNLEIHLQSC